MADILGTLGQIGRGALTGTSMALAASQGKDPLAILEERKVRAQQLQNAQLEGLLKHATAIYDNPGVRALAERDPRVATALGLPTETVSGASASFPMDPGAGAALPVGTGQPGGGGQTIQPQGHQQFSRTRGVLPPEVETTGSVAREASKAKANYYTQLLQMAQGDVGGMPAAGGASAAAPAGRPPMRLTGFGPSGPSFGLVPETRIRAGTPNPETGQDYVTGDRSPGGGIALVEPIKGTATQRARANVYRGAIERIDNFMKDFQPEERARYAGAINYASRRGKDIGSQIPGVKRLTGPVDKRFNSFNAGVASIRRFMFEEGGKALTAQEMAVLDPLVVSGVEKAGPEEFESKLTALRGALAERLAIEEQSGGQLPSSPGQPAPTAASSATAPAGAPAGLDDINARRKALGITDPYVARAKGGGVKKGQTALVGEAGPELVMRPQFIQGPAQVQPLQLAQSMPWAPRQLQAPQEQPAQQLIPPPRPDDSGLSRGGVGLRPEDIQAAQQGGQVVWDAVLDRAVVVPR